MRQSWENGLNGRLGTKGGLSLSTWYFLDLGAPPKTYASSNIWEQEPQVIIGHCPDPSWTNCLMALSGLGGAGNPGVSAYPTICTPPRPSSQLYFNFPLRRFLASFPCLSELLPAQAEADSDQRRGPGKCHHFPSGFLPH